MEQLVEHGKGRVFGKVMINEEEFYQQTTRLKKALPDDLKKAEHVSRSSTKVLSEANAEAKRLVDEAQAEAKRTLGEAQAEANRLLSEAAAGSERMTNDARAQADRVIGEARAQAERMVADARSQTESSLNDARSQASRIVEDARREAERIVADAKTQAEQLTSEHTITQNAQQFAAAHQQAALDDAEQIRAQADEYAMQVLDRVEGALAKLMSSVEEGKQQLREHAGT